MTDHAPLHPLSLERLLEWIARERAARGTVFGLHEDLFRDDLRGKPFGLRRRGARLESPVGVAAGPHTQLSPNLVAAWLCGARFLELKTVQTLDELDIARPCIDMADEGYNCEWSQELPIDVSADQYLDAWVAIRLLQMQAGSLTPDEPGFVMDLSVGYDLAGVRGDKVQRFLDRMTAASRAEIEARLARAARVVPAAADLPAPEAVASSVTLSTMHGCPPDEIERIAAFLLTERGLDTTVKLNPTLLGPDVVRGLLNDTLGFDAEVPDAAFGHDIGWDAACELIGSLQRTAARCGRRFGLKLTNTLECVNRRGVLPAAESMNYLSGRALHPVAVHTALRLQQAFDGALDISFAGGADAFNVVPLAGADLGPVTVCSDLLRPGGYQRLHQYLEQLEDAFTAVGAADGEAFVRATAGTDDLPAARLANLAAHARTVLDDPAYRRDTYPDRTIKTDRPLGRLDCVAAPCAHTCPAGQDVPEYMRRTADGDLGGALDVVLRANAFPTVTGMVCDHPCVERCTRVNMDAPVRIRDIKRTLAHLAPEPAAAVAGEATGRRAAIVGGGPAGLACARELALAGVAVTVYEAKDLTGGMITDAIPSFRLTGDDYRRDLARIVALGVQVRCGERIDRARLDELRREHDAVLLAIGAQRDRALGVEGEDLPGVWPALALLSAARRGAAPALGREVVVIGGGNTAMDAARTAVRLADAGGTVHVAYRRTVAEMPAAREELQAIVDEGVRLHELLSPVAVRRAGERLELVCRPMRLGAPDASGRPRPEPAPGPPRVVACDAVITAVGQELAGDLLPGDFRGSDAAAPVPGLPGVYVAGDAMRGAATLVEAMGDGRRAAAAMLDALGLPPGVTAGDRAPRHLDDAAWQDRAARRLDPVLPELRPAGGHGDFGLVIGELSADEARREAARCLDCSTRCDVCVSVCPDRANVAYTTAPRRWSLSRVAAGPAGPVIEPDGEFVVAQDRQTCNLRDFCNQCGNCVTFCPTAGAPWRDKPRVTASRAVYEAEDGLHLLTRRGDELTVALRRDGVEHVLTRRGNVWEYAASGARILLDGETFAVTGARLPVKTDQTVGLRTAAEMAVLLDGLADHPVVITEDS